MLDYNEQQGVLTFRPADMRQDPPEVLSPDFLIQIPVGAELTEVCQNPHLQDLLDTWLIALYSGVVSLVANRDLEVQIMSRFFEFTQDLEQILTGDHPDRIDPDLFGPFPNRMNNLMTG